MVSYQCSGHSTASGIQDVFKLAAKYHIRNNERADDFVSVVVLDEVGLAEGSEHMPLKVYFTLLCQESIYVTEVKVKRICKTVK